MTIATPSTGPRTFAGTVTRGRAVGESVPTIAHTNRLGIAIRSTASNAPTIDAITTVAASATAARRSRSCDAARARTHAPTRSPIIAITYSRTAGNPRSATSAIQSLLGHGFDVIPSSFSDGSLRDANRGYSTAQFPGPTPKTGFSTAIRRELRY